MPVRKVSILKVPEEKVTVALSRDFDVASDGVLAFGKSLGQALLTRSAFATMDHLARPARNEQSSLKLTTALP